MTEKEEKDEAYRQRNHLVAALARLFPSGIKRTVIPGWDPEWHGCCFIDLPSGQISYHYHDSHAHLFAELPEYLGAWDGHDKEAVHERLLMLNGAPVPETEIYREALEGYACRGLGECPEKRLSDGTCLRTISGLCGNDAHEALACFPRSAAG